MTTAPGSDPSLSGNGRSETHLEQMDRNWVELLQELRVLQTGTQILAGFLLILPFQTAFNDLGTVLRTVYLAAMSLALATTILLLAPVSAHRLLFRRRRKEELVRLGDRFARLGMTSLALTLGSVLCLVFGIVVGVTAGAVAGTLTAILIIICWQILPRRLLS